MSRGKKVEVPATVVLSYDERKRLIRCDVRVDGLPRRTFYVRDGGRSYGWAFWARRRLIEGGVHVT